MKFQQQNLHPNYYQQASSVGSPLGMIRYKMSSVWGITGSIRAVSGLHLAARHLLTVIVMEKIMRDDTSEATAVKYSPRQKVI